MNQVNYVRGDVLKGCDAFEGAWVNAHIVNNIGAWGGGYTGQIDLIPELRVVGETYRSEHRRYYLGKVQMVKIPGSRGNAFANLFAQNGLRSSTNPVPLDLRALESCVRELSDYLIDMKTWFPEISVHMPRIGCGLAGGKWEDVEPVVQTLTRVAPVFVYDL